MTRLMVGMGEIGVMHPGNAGIVTALGTFGASPCIILGIQKGTTALLAHIHRANDLRQVMQQVRDILGDALPAQATARAFIATETYTGPVPGEANVQDVLINFLETKLIELGIRLIEKNRTKSAAVISYEAGYKLSGDDAFNFGPQEIQDIVKWTEAYDKRFRGRTGQLPMAIRVGINFEDPETAVSRLYPQVHVG
jgi:hypothetical protein